jgi:hypothetical protein
MMASAAGSMGSFAISRELSNTVVIYKGQTVAVTRVNKSELTLTKQDLVDLANVGDLIVYIVFSP